MNSQSSTIINQDETPPSLFEKQEVRVSDLVGDLRVLENKTVNPTPLFVAAPPVRRNGPLRLDWYDWSVVVLVIASLIAGVVSLLSGV